MNIQSWFLFLGVGLGFLFHWVCANWLKYYRAEQKRDGINRIDIKEFTSGTNED